MRRFLFALLSFGFISAASAQQVPTPMAAPASVTAGDVLATTSNRQQAADSGKLIPFGAILGTTDTQTVTNKSIDASEINSGTINELQLPNTLNVGKDFVGGILSPVIVDLSYYGVLCNGSADDYGDISQAITDWSAGNVKLLVPFGNCKTSAPIYIGTNGANHVHFVGAGGMNGTTITATFTPVANQGIIVISAADPTVSAALEDDVSDMQITRASTSTAQGDALQILNCNTCNFHDILVSANYIGIEEAGGNANKFTRITSFGATAYSGAPAGGAAFYVHSEPKSGGGTWEPFTIQVDQFNFGGGTHQQYGIDITACDGCQFHLGYLGAHPIQIYIVPETDTSTFIDATEFVDIREDNADAAGAGGMCFEIDTNASRPNESFYGIGVYGGWCDNSTYGFVINNKNANVDLVGIKGNTNNLVVLDNWLNVNITSGHFLNYSGIGISSAASSNCGYLTINGNTFYPGSGTSAITLGACSGGTPTATISGNNYNGLSSPVTIDSSWSATRCANVSSGVQLGCSGYYFTFNGSSSGTTVLQPSATASGVLTLPAATDTLVGRATTDTLTNKSIAGSEINSGTIPSAQLPANSKLSDISFIISGNGSPITTGIKGYLPIDFGCTISQSRIVADQSGSIVIDVWKAAGAVPTVTNTITASALPTLSSAQLATDSTLTGWTTSVSAGDIFGFNVNSASTVTQVTISLKCTKT